MERLALAVGAWLQFVRGQDAQGQDLPLDDPLGAPLRRHADTVDRFVGLAPVFGTLSTDAEWIAAVQRQMRHLTTHGPLGAAARLVSAG